MLVFPLQEKFRGQIVYGRGEFISCVPVFDSIVTLDIWAATTCFYKKIHRQNREAGSVFHLGQSKSSLSCQLVLFIGYCVANPRMVIRDARMM